MEDSILILLILVQCVCTLGATVLGYKVGRRSKVMGEFPGDV